MEPRKTLREGDLERERHAVKQKTLITIDYRDTKWILLSSLDPDSQGHHGSHKCWNQQVPLMHSNKAGLWTETDRESQFGSAQHPSLAWLPSGRRADDYGILEDMTVKMEVKWSAPRLWTQEANDRLPFQYYLRIHY